MTACATCTHWAIKTSPLARHGAAPCAHQPRWDYYPPHQSCARHTPAAPEVVAARLAWLDKLDHKHKVNA
jgi:hypothetical protein